MDIVLRPYPNPYPTLHNNTSTRKKGEAIRQPLGTVSFRAGMARLTVYNCQTWILMGMRPGVNDGGISQQSIAAESSPYGRHNGPRQHGSRSQMPAMSPQLYLLLFRMRFPTTDAQYLRRLHGCQQYPLNSLMSSLFRMHSKRQMHNTTGKCLKAQRASQSIMPRREMLSALLGHRHLTIMPPA